MATRRKSRRNMLARSSRSKNSRDSLFKRLCRSIHQGKLIPVIGETIRIGHIFDPPGLRLEVEEDAYDEEFFDDMDEENGIDDPESDEEEEQLGLNVIEDLSYYWAKDIHYPLQDRKRMASVAQYYILKQGNAIAAKEDYLEFLKSKLLDVAQNVADIKDQPDLADLVEDLRLEQTYSFAQIVDELDFPDFADGQEDPLRILARLPLKIYVTTGHFDFIERALKAEGKRPRSCLCFWNMRPENVEKEHRCEESYEPSVEAPVVYHLLGMEQYPGSLVLSEDDYLNFLWQLARDLPGDSGERIIPPYLEAELNTSSLLLLGYQLQDWDFRMIYHGLLKSQRQNVSQRGFSVAIQIDPKEQQPLVEDESEAKLYLNRYFDKIEFRVKWGDSDDFVVKLWQAWLQFNQGGQK